MNETQRAALAVLILDTMRRFLGQPIQPETRLHPLPNGMQIEAFAAILAQALTTHRTDAPSRQVVARVLRQSQTAKDLVEALTRQIDRPGSMHSMSAPRPSGGGTLGFELRSSTGAKSAHRSTTGGARDAARSAPPRPTAPEPAKKPDLAAVVSLKVFYATDRKPTDLDPDNSEIQRYGGEWDDQVHYGECRITLPEDRGLGAFPRPAWWRFDFQEDPKRHIIAHSVTPMAEAPFFQSLSSVVGGSTTKEALVFVHGFNVSFKNAALRTAQLAVDLKFDGAPILYSWPARAGPMGAAAYAADANTIEKTYDHLTVFLQDVARRTGARRIHVLAHSMGNRAACNALERIAVTTPAAAVPIFGQVVLAAPDLDQQRFKQLVAKFQSHTSQVTLYASSKDKALKLSKRFNAAPRAGEPMVVLAGMDSVDASNVDTDLLGHGFFSDARSVLSDIFGVIRDEAVAKRFNLQSYGDHYRFRP